MYDNKEIIQKFYEEGQLLPPKGGSLLQPIVYPKTKVYLQIKPVTNLPNAPRRNDGQKSAFGREEGYADYRRGYFYVDPYDFGEIK